MTYDEAVSMIDRIKNYAIGTPIKGKFIESFFIGPSDWQDMNTFLNVRSQKGEEEAINEFFEKSFSVYGISVTKTTDEVPRWDMTILDDLETIISN